MQPWREAVPNSDSLQAVYQRERWRLARCRPGVRSNNKHVEQEVLHLPSLLVRGSLCDHLCWRHLPCPHHLRAKLQASFGEMGGAEGRKGIVGQQGFLRLAFLLNGSYQL